MADKISGDKMQPAAKITTELSKLRKVSTELVGREFGDLERVLAVMRKTMCASGGAGLAAPQVGIRKRFFIMAIDGEEPMACVNPRIIQHMPLVTEASPEGCLSIPGRTFLVRRPRIILVSYQTETADFREEYLTDWNARIFQHELDHLDGVLILDRGEEVIADDTAIPLT
jgi:peptide deformylase